MRVYGTSGQVSRLTYAAKIGAAIADSYESYFDIKYPLPKLDMAAIPDYSSGATEHWGLITYRETNLIYDPSESSFSNKALLLIPPFVDKIMAGLYYPLPTWGRQIFVIRSPRPR